MRICVAESTLFTISFDLTFPSEGSSPIASPLLSKLAPKLIQRSGFLQSKFGKIKGHRLNPTELTLMFLRRNLLVEVVGWAPSGQGVSQAGPKEE